MDYDECFRVATEIARKAGEEIRAAFVQTKQVELKESIADLVTETDQRVEKLIIAGFKEKFPTHSFIGEESTAAGVKNELTDNPTWIIDPIDGTTNFVHRFPFVAVSIGFLVNKKPEIGVVYNPILDQMYTARSGQGAFCNDKQIYTTKTEEMQNALVCTEFGSNRDPAKLDAKVRSMRKVVSLTHGLRCLGSAAMNMCQVASGSVDAFYEAGIHAWDIAGGSLIVTEAGGVVMDTEGGPLNMMGRRILCAGTDKLARQVAECLEPVEFEHD